MSLIIDHVVKTYGRNKGDRYILREVKTPRYAVFTSLKSARVSKRELEEGRAHWCECDHFVLGVPGRVDAHRCF